MGAIFRFLLAWAAMAIAPVWAEGEKSVPVEPLSRELVTPGAVMQLLAGLGVVVAAIVLVAWLVRRVGGVNTGTGKLRVVSALTLGQRERVVLVQVGEKQQVLLGVTPSQITRLAEYDEPVASLDVAANDFAERLRGAMGRQGKSSK